MCDNLGPRRRQPLRCERTTHRRLQHREWFVLLLSVPLRRHCKKQRNIPSSKKTNLCIPHYPTQYQQPCVVVYQQVKHTCIYQYTKVSVFKSLIKLMRPVRRGLLKSLSNHCYYVFAKRLVK